MLSHTEENYLKAIYQLSEGDRKEVSTNAISEYLDTRPASVSDMIRKLAEKELIHYKKYKGVRLTKEGLMLALQVLRKHRLWEVFLVKKLGFNWDEVHDVAEQLEHIQSPLLVKKLDEFLGHPSFDPHGDPIPTESGEMPGMLQVPLSDTELDGPFVVIGVKDSSTEFLQHLDSLGIRLGLKLQIQERAVYDGSITLEADSRIISVSKEVAENLFVSSHKNA